jgi:hypothetical protein
VWSGSGWESGGSRRSSGWVEAHRGVANRGPTGQACRQGWPEMGRGGVFAGPRAGKLPSVVALSPPRHVAKVPNPRQRSPTTIASTTHHVGRSCPQPRAGGAGLHHHAPLPTPMRQLGSSIPTLNDSESNQLGMRMGQGARWSATRGDLRGATMVDGARGGRSVRAVARSARAVSGARRVGIDGRGCP